MDQFIEVFSVHPFSEEIEYKDGKIKMTNSHLSHWVRNSTTKDYVSMVLVTNLDSSIQILFEHNGQREVLLLHIQLFYFKLLGEKETIIVDVNQILPRQTLYQIGKVFETNVDLKRVNSQEIRFSDVVNGHELLFI